MQSSESSAIWVTASLPTKQSSSSINVRWAWGRVPLSAWLRPHCCCQSPQARSRCPAGDNDTRLCDDATPEGEKGESDSWAERWRPRSAPLPRRCTHQGDESEEKGIMTDGRDWLHCVKSSKKEIKNESREESLPKFASCYFPPTSVPTGCLLLHSTITNSK